MDKDDLIFRFYTPASFSVLKVDYNEIRGGWGGGGVLGKIGYVGYWSRTVAINVLLSFNFGYISYYSMYFCFHPVKQKSISPFSKQTKCSESFAALHLFELFSFAAIRREIEMVRKMEMGKEIAMGREMDRGKDGDS